MSVWRGSDQSFISSPSEFCVVVLLLCPLQDGRGVNVATAYGAAKYDTATRIMLRQRHGAAAVLRVGMEQWGTMRSAGRVMRWATLQQETWWDGMRLCLVEGCGVGTVGDYGFRRAVALLLLLRRRMERILCCCRDHNLLHYGHVP